MHSFEGEEGREIDTAGNSPSKMLVGVMDEGCRSGGRSNEASFAASDYVCDASAMIK